MPASTYTALVLNCQWNGFLSTNVEGARPWPERCRDQAKIIHDTGVTLVLAQEIDRKNRDMMAAALGARWNRQGFGLNGVFWRDEWTLDDPDHGNESRDFPLNSYGQLARTALSCRLVHQSGQYVHAASTHFASDRPDLTVSHLAAQQGQARQVVAHFQTYRQLLLGADIQTFPSVRRIFSQAGWRWGNNGSVITAAAKSRVRILSVHTVPVGTASDHSAKKVTFSIVNPPDPA